MCHNKNELRSAVAKYRRLRAQKDDIDRQLKDAQQDIFDYFEYNGISAGQKIQGQNYIVSYSNVISNRWDSKLLDSFLASEGRSASEFKTSSSYRRLNVK
jgi:hypothetical protein